ncbi:hypothetical protein BSPWISOXPB_4344 [uncultured Gammaproteobacteria bacterium]|nr:hypothetical protein BSPWISOXPB_4344 [uncultured Gammaproteobacteria bacterium]
MHSVLLLEHSGLVVVVLFVQTPVHLLIPLMTILGMLLLSNATLINLSISMILSAQGRSEPTVLQFGGTYLSLQAYENPAFY